MNKLRKRLRFLSLTGLGFVLLASCFLLLASAPVLAQTPPPTDYKLLAPIPQLLKPGSVDSSNAVSFLPGIIKLMIGLATALAVIMLVWGGIQYMSTDAWGGKSDAKKTITDALVGLLLAISAWLILYTINPKLVEINILSNIPKQTIAPTPTITGSGGVAGVPMTAAELAADRQVRNRLEAPSAGVKINAGPCTQGEGYGCTNLNGLPEAAIQGLINLKAACGTCVVRVSGGTEPGPHQTHGVGEAVADLSNDPSLRSWLASKGYLINNGNGAVVPLPSSRVSFIFERAGQGNSTGDHWHLVF